MSVQVYIVIFPISIKLFLNRPITVPSNLLRLITTRMCEKMTNIVESNQMLGPEQYGFRRGRSTSDAVFVLTSLLQKAKGKS